MDPNPRMRRRSAPLPLLSPSRAGASHEGAPSAALETRFRSDFERCFARAYRFVRARTRSREEAERVVRQVLEANVDLFLEPRSELEEARRLLSSAAHWLREPQEPSRDL